MMVRKFRCPLGMFARYGQWNEPPRPKFINKSVRRRQLPERSFDTKLPGVTTEK